MNEVLTELKKKYSEYLNKLGNVKEQKHEFIMILKRFEESNDIK
jgi:hypothetical protein